MNPGSASRRPRSVSRSAARAGIVCGSLALLLTFRQAVRADTCDDYEAAVLANWVYDTSKCCQPDQAAWDTAHPTPKSGETCSPSGGGCTINGTTWTIFNEETGEGGFDAATFVHENTDGTVDVTIAYRGTEMGEFDGDLLADLRIGAGLGGDEQYEQAADYYSEQVAALSSAYPGGQVNVSFTGHSLGGSLALAMGVQYGEPTFTFNPLGLDPETFPVVGGQYGNISTNVADGDFLQCVNQILGFVVPGQVSVNDSGLELGDKWCKNVERALDCEARIPGMCSMLDAVALAEMINGLVEHSSLSLAESLAQECSDLAGEQLPLPERMPEVVNPWIFDDPQ